MSKKILFVDPSYPDTNYQRNIAPSMGIGYVAETLELNGHDCHVVDLGLGHNLDYLFDQIEDYQPDYLAMCLMTFNYKHLYSILMEANKKKSACGFKIVAGGPHVSSWKDKVLNQCDAIDYGIYFEGEEAMLELVNDKDISLIKGLIYRDGGKIIVNEQRTFVTDLDSTPFPRYSAFEMDKYEGLVHICASRGCPYLCTFCQAQNTLGKKWRRRSPQNVVQEMRHWYDRGYREFSFIDDNFTLQKHRVLEICDEIENSNFTKIKIGAVGVRADRVDEEILVRMKSAGFKYLAFGVEGGNDRILKTLKKHETIDQIDKTVDMATSLGYEIKLYFLVGSPGESLEDIKDSIKFAKKYPIKSATFSNLIPYPETEVFDWIKDNGRFLADPEEYLNNTGEFTKTPVFETADLSFEERKEALKITGEAIIEIEQNYKDLHSNGSSVHHEWCN